jgi:hypothetical protein
MDVKLLGQLHQRAVALDCCDRHLRLKADAWFRRLLLLMLSPDSRANPARCQAEAPLIALCREAGSLNCESVRVKNSAAPRHWLRYSVSSSWRSARAKFLMG